MTSRLTIVKFLDTIIILFLASGTISFAAPTPPRMNVVLLVLDQLRADQLHCYGNPRDTSPNIDRLAERGVRFSHYYTVAPWTSPSFASLHTSLYPSRHGVTLLWKPGMPLIDKETPMLTMSFKYHGYYTAAFVDNALAGKDLTGRGFDEYHKEYAAALNVTERIGRNGSDLAINSNTANEVSGWLTKHRRRPFFLYVHFLAPHSPYDPPPEDDIFKSDAYPYMSDTGYDIAHGALLRLAMLGDQKAIERLYQLYDGKIHFADRCVGEILDRLRALGLDHNTLVFLTSDHGELLYSHPKDFLTFDHRSLYNTVLHIPFIVAGPGVPRGETRNGLGSNIDTTPTILNLAGLPPLSGAQGRSLVPMIDGKTSSGNQYVYAEEDIAIPERSIQSTRYKLILNLWTGQEQLFDEKNDPKELTNVAKEHPHLVRELDARLRDWIKENEPSKIVQLRRWRIYTAPQKVVTVDDQTTGGGMLLTGGGWRSDTNLRSGSYDGGCFLTEGGDGSRTAVWRADNPFVGTYKIFVYYGHPPIAPLASNAPFTIVTRSSAKTVRVNFNEGAGHWHLLAIVKNPLYVRETNAANGAIIVDAIQFERVVP